MISSISSIKSFCLYIHTYKDFIMLSKYKGLVGNPQWRFQPYWEYSIDVGLLALCLHFEVEVASILVLDE